MRRILSLLFGKTKYNIHSFYDLYHRNNHIINVTSQKMEDNKIDWAMDYSARLYFEKILLGYQYIPIEWKPGTYVLYDQPTAKWYGIDLDAEIRRRAKVLQDEYEAIHGPIKSLLDI